MTDTGMRFQLDDAREEIELRVKDLYSYAFDIRGQHCYKAGNIYIMISAIHGFGALVVEYASTEDEARKGRFEDGDLFYIEDYKDVDAIYSDVVAEIQYSMD